MKKLGKEIAQKSLCPFSHIYALQSIGRIDKSGTMHLLEGYIGEIKDISYADKIVERARKEGFI